MQDLTRLIAGFRKFHTDYFRGDNELFSQLKKGQHPRLMSRSLKSA